MPLSQLQGIARMEGGEGSFYENLHHRFMTSARWDEKPLVDENETLKLTQNNLFCRGLHQLSRNVIVIHGHIFSSLYYRAYRNISDMAKIQMRSVKLLLIFIYLRLEIFSAGLDEALGKLV